MRDQHTDLRSYSERTFYHALQTFEVLERLCEASSSQHRRIPLEQQLTRTHDAVRRRQGGRGRLLRLSHEDPPHPIAIRKLVPTKGDLPVQPWTARRGRIPHRRDLGEYAPVGELVTDVISEAIQATVSKTVRVSAPVF